MGLERKLYYLPVRERDFLKIDRPDHRRALHYTDVAELKRIKWLSRDSVNWRAVGAGFGYGKRRRALNARAATEGRMSEATWAWQRKHRHSARNPEGQMIFSRVRPQKHKTNKEEPRKSGFSSGGSAKVKVHPTSCTAAAISNRTSPNGIKTWKVGQNGVGLEDAKRASRLSNDVAVSNNSALNWALSLFGLNGKIVVNQEQGIQPNKTNSNFVISGGNECISAISRSTDVAVLSVSNMPLTPKEIVARDGEIRSDISMFYKPQYTTTEPRTNLNITEIHAENKNRVKEGESPVITLKIPKGKYISKAACPPSFSVPKTGLSAMPMGEGIIPAISGSSNVKNRGEKEYSDDYYLMVRPPRKIFYPKLASSAAAGAI